MSNNNANGTKHYTKFRSLNNVTFYVALDLPFINRVRILYAMSHNLAILVKNPRNNVANSYIIFKGFGPDSK